MTSLLRCLLPKVNFQYLLQSSGCTKNLRYISIIISAKTPAKLSLRRTSLSASWPGSTYNAIETRKVFFFFLVISEILFGFRPQTVKILSRSQYKNALALAFPVEKDVSLQIKIKYRKVPRKIFQFLQLGDLCSSSALLLRFCKGSLQIIYPSRFIFSPVYFIFF